MSYANVQVQDHYFKSSVDLDISTSTIAGKYLKSVITSSIVWMLIAGALIGYCICFSHGATWETAVGIFGGFLEIVLTLRVITALLSAGKISKGNFTWTSGMLTGYKLHAGVKPRAPFYLYAVINEEFMCNCWANPKYKKGTIVYFLVVGNSEFSPQNIIIKRAGYLG